MDTLVSRAVAVAELTCERSQDEGYLLLFTGDETVRSLAMQMGQGHGEPRLILQANVPDSEMAQGLGASLVGKLGAEALSAASVASAGTIFAADVEGSGVLLALYDSAAPILINWHAEDGAVSMQAMLLPFDDLAACEGKEEVGAWFVSQGVKLSFAEAETDLPLMPAEQDVDLLARASRLIDRLNAKAEKAALEASDKLASLMTGWAAEDRETPRLILRMELSALSPEWTELLWMLTGQETFDKTLLTRALTSLPWAMIGALSGVQELAASAMCSQESLFAAQGVADAGLLLYLYEEATPVLVAWQAENGAVLMRGSYVPGEALMACESAEDVASLMAAIGLALPWEAVE